METIQNRRQDQRIPAEGLAIRVKKAGLGSVWHDFELCTTVDFSLNGLAFVSLGTDFKVPEKVEFILNIADHEIKGSGIVCHRHLSEHGFQFGLMFLSVSPEISSLVEDDTPSRQVSKIKAELCAEQMAYKLWESHGQPAPWQRLKAQELVDVVRSYLNRLGELGIKLQSGDDTAAILPIQAVRLYRQADEGLLLCWKTPVGEQSIAVKLQKRQFPAAFLVNDQTVCQTPLQVAELLGEQLMPVLRVS
ncbi:MAG: PilZ domain-containing protein [Methylomonas sp.]|nr:PilZ domain-containing protein [Methylomonas sp.]PPD19932.1 MAG: hypothetical protein CTY23_10465 [Methylomonas sp.]PPD25471.1 MAG: hypothetical protein CTY22_08480 [Methylomonas sp.]PPD36171.1 MAG: hypothetical protein CTY21_08485 [Methylomonas sp.]PPD39718.1 MAG: hypothetical protein CTY17_07725 [Methylomonas sp.]